jgi:hypothetical protein
MDREQASLLIALERRVSQALVRNGGLKLTAEELGVLATIGLVDSISHAKANILKEQVQSRRSKVVSINAASSGSTTSAGQTASRPAQAGTSGGTTLLQAGSFERARARTMFDSRATG